MLEEVRTVHYAGAEDSRWSSLLAQATAWVLLATVAGLCVLALSTQDRNPIAPWKLIARDAFKQRQRANAIYQLGKIGTAEAVNALLPVFSDPFVHLHDRVVSAWIAAMKGKHGSEVQTWLTQRGFSHRDPRVRRAVAVTLGLTSGKEIEEPLRVAIAKEKDGAVLEALATAAVRLREPPALKGALLDKLTHKDGAAVFAITVLVLVFNARGQVHTVHVVVFQQGLYSLLDHARRDHGLIALYQDESRTWSSTP